MSGGTVEAVALSAVHGFSKSASGAIGLVAGLGVAGDAHAGHLVKHRSRVARDPTQPNLRQVHLIHGELFDELRLRGFDIGPAMLGENITTRGIDLLALPRGTVLRLGAEAAVAVSGLRNPCSQLDDFAPGLMRAVLDRAPDGRLIRKAGVMAIVLRSGPVRAGDPIDIELPALPHLPLEPV